MGGTYAGRLAAAVITAAAGSIWAAEFKPADGGAPLRLGWCAAPVTDTPVERGLKEPAKKPVHPAYMSIRLGSGEDAVITGLFDAGTGMENAGGEIILDLNNNGDLMDDPAPKLEISRSESATTITTGPVNATVRYEGGAKRIVSIMLEMRGYPKPPAEGLCWDVACSLNQHMEGKVDFGGRKGVLTGIYDSTRGKIESNGCFDDYCADRLRIDINGDGKLDEDTEDFPLSRIVVFDGKFWNFKADSAAEKVEVSPCEPPAGRIRFDLNFASNAAPPGGAIELTSEAGTGFKYPLSQKGFFNLPEGEYNLMDAMLSLVDGEGRKWTALFALAKPVVIERKKDAVVAIGRPFRIVPDIHSEEVRRGTDLCIGHALSGAGGEEYESIAPEQTRMVSTIRVIGPDDIVLAEGNMEYG